MNNNDFEIRSLYQNILVGLLSIKKFRKNYYARNKSLRNIIANFLHVPSLEKKEDRKFLINAVRDEEFIYANDGEFFDVTMYKNLELIKNIFCRCNSIFNGLSKNEIRLLIIIELCCKSALRDVFYSSDDPFPFRDFCLLCEYVLQSKRKSVLISVKNLLKAEIISFSGAKKMVTLQPVFHNELLRLSEIPSMQKFDLSYFKVTGSDADKPFSECNLITYTGAWSSSYIFTKLEKEKIRYWYAGDTGACLRILHFLIENQLKDQYIWLDDYDNVEKEAEKMITSQAEKINTKLIISGSKLKNAFNKECIAVSVDDAGVVMIVRELFPNEVEKSLCYFLPKLSDSEKKYRFLIEASKVIENAGVEYAIQSIPDLFSKINCVDSLDSEEENSSEALKVVDEKEFIKRYGNSEFTGNASDSAVRERIKEIYKKLQAPADYLRADKEMFGKIENLFNLHPNILDKEKLFAFLQNAILFSKGQIISLPPLLFLGNPGCGKTLLCRQLREVFGQDNDVFLPMGTGGGVSALLGSTPEYKSASHGKILAGIWEATEKINCLNPLIVCDEISQCGHTSDSNQQVFPVLLQLLGMENMKHFHDNFFDVPIHNFQPNFICTANSLEPIPEALMDRINVIKFRDYTEQELKNTLIPYQYEIFKNSHNELVPENLSEDEIDLIYKMSEGKPRRIQPCINMVLAASFDINGKRIKLDSIKREYLLKTYADVKQETIGFSF